MNAIPVPNADEVRDNATFEALMWALARPGEIRRLPEPGLSPAILALVDYETTVFTDDPELAPLVLRTGARPADAATAEYLFLTSDTPRAATDASIGTAIAPESGATLVIAADLSGGPRLRLTGPGIDGSLEAAPGLSPEFWGIRGRRLSYPLGYDLFVIEGDRVLGLPRSTRVEVL